VASRGPAAACYGLKGHYQSKLPEAMRREFDGAVFFVRRGEAPDWHSSIIQLLSYQFTQVLRLTHYDNDH
jgi:hypothetical protein